MASPRTIYLFSPEEAGRESLQKLAANLGHGQAMQTEEVATFEELKGRMEGGQIEFLLLDAKAVGSKMIQCLGEPDPERLLTMSLAELEKRQILRVLASTGGNKTRAARVLGIDTKTLYNKLKSYQVSESARKRRVETARSVETA